MEASEYQAITARLIPEGQDKFKTGLIGVLGLSAHWQAYREAYKDYINWVIRHDLFRNPNQAQRAKELKDDAIQKMEICWQALTDICYANDISFSEIMDRNANWWPSSGDTGSPIGRLCDLYEGMLNGDQIDNSELREALDDTGTFLTICTVDDLSDFVGGCNVRGVWDRSASRLKRTYPGIYKDAD